MTPWTATSYTYWAYHALTLILDLPNSAFVRYHILMYHQKELRTYVDRRQYMIRAVAKRRRKIKAMAIAYKGGACQICGYDKYQGALDLHHLNPAEKEFTFGNKGYTRAWEKVKAELDKCVLVCANCHREVEAGFSKLTVEF